MVSNLDEALRILAVAPWVGETGSSGGAKRRWFSATHTCLCSPLPPARLPARNNLWLTNWFASIKTRFQSSSSHWYALQAITPARHTLALISKVTRAASCGKMRKWSALSLPKVCLFLSVINIWCVDMPDVRNWVRVGLKQKIKNWMMTYWARFLIGGENLKWEKKGKINDEIGKLKRWIRKGNK